MFGRREGRLFGTEAVGFLMASNNLLNRLGCPAFQFPAARKGRHNLDHTWLSQGKFVRNSQGQFGFNLAQTRPVWFYFGSFKASVALTWL